VLKITFLRLPISRANILYINGAELSFKNPGTKRGRPERKTSVLKLDFEQVVLNFVAPRIQNSAVEIINTGVQSRYPYKLL